MALIVLCAAAATTHWQQSSDGTVTAEPPVQIVARSSPSSTTPGTAGAPFASTGASAPGPSSSSRPGSVIRQAEATGITIPAIGYRAAVGQMPTDANGDVNPPTLQDTYRITNRGVAPGTEATNTVYLACHSYSRGFAPCNLVFALAKPGQHVLLDTAAGTLDYVIQTTRLYAKTGEFKSSSEVRAVVPGRLVLVTCFQKNDGSASTHNFVVVAQLAR